MSDTEIGGNVTNLFVLNRHDIWPNYRPCFLLEKAVVWREEILFHGNLIYELPVFPYIWVKKVGRSSSHPVHINWCFEHTWVIMQQCLIMIYYHKSDATTYATFAIEILSMYISYIYSLLAIWRGSQHMEFAKRTYVQWCESALVTTFSLSWWKGPSPSLSIASSSTEVLYQQLWW